MVQAQTQEAEGPLYAEAQATLLVSTIALAVGFNSVTYFTEADLAAILQNNNIVHPGEWRLRPLVEDFMNHHHNNTYHCAQDLKDSECSCSQFGEAGTATTPLHCLYTSGVVVV